MRAVSHPGAGAVPTFLGVVRETNEGRAVSLLEYEAYGSMAEAELARIEAELESAEPGIKVFATHRIGALHVGDVAVVCAASAPHRGEAFRACRKLIDEIKASPLQDDPCGVAGVASRVGGRHAPPRLVFHALPEPGEEEVEEVAERTAQRVQKLLLRHGRSLDDYGRARRARR